MISTWEIVLRLLLGAAFGGIIGYERQVHGRPAGFRTHMLVCIASVLIMEVSEYFHYLGSHDPSYIRIDPGRIAAGAITGVGFLGAGVIVKTGATVQGLTTAACLWMVSAIGLAVGTGIYSAAIAAFGLTLFALLVLRAVERATSKSIFKTLIITAETGGFEEAEVMAVLGKLGASVHDRDYELDVAEGETTIRIMASIQDSVPLNEVVDGVSTLPGVRKVNLRS